MKTAVEWLLEELPKVYVEHRHLVIEQANKMFEQQIIDAFYKGIQEQTARALINAERTTPEQYYNENYDK